jgi:hypothetical protein
VLTPNTPFPPVEVTFTRHQIFVLTLQIKNFVAEHFGIYAVELELKDKPRPLTRAAFEILESTEALSGSGPN